MLDHDKDEQDLDKRCRNGEKSMETSRQNAKSEGRIVDDPAFLFCGRL
jgi:hypothetical protein